MALLLLATAGFAEMWTMSLLIAFIYTSKSMQSILASSGNSRGHFEQLINQDNSNGRKLVE